MTKLHPFLAAEMYRKAIVSTAVYAAFAYTFPLVSVELPSNTIEAAILTLEETRLLVAQCRGILRLDGLTNLTPEIAEELATYRGGLSLNGLTYLSSGLAESLAKHENALSLDGLATLSPDVAERLARHPGGLSLKGLTSLSTELAEAFIVEEITSEEIPVWAIPDPFQGEGVRMMREQEKRPRRYGYLSLGGLTSLSPEVAEILAKREGQLFLVGITTLSPELALALAKKPSGILYLSGLTTIPLKAAEALAGSDCSVSLGSTMGDPGKAHFARLIDLRAQRKQATESGTENGGPSAERTPDQRDRSSPNATVSKLPESEFQSGRNWFRSKRLPCPTDTQEIQASATSFVDYIVTRPDSGRYQKPLDHLAKVLEPLVKANRRQELALAVGDTPKAYFLIYKELLDNCRWGERPAIDVDIPMSQSQLVSYCVDAYADRGKADAKPADVPNRP